MLYKVFLIFTIICCSAAIGIMGEKRVIRRKEQLKSVLRAIKCVKGAVTDQGMTLSDALIYCGAREQKVFAKCGELVKKNPKMGARQIVKDAFDENGEYLSELEKEDRNVFSGFMEGMFGAVSGEEVRNTCDRYCNEISEVLDEIDGTYLKKARLKKSMCILGGIAVSIILI